MTKYIIVDTSNLFFRCRHVTQGDAFTRAAMSLHIMFRSLRKLWREYKADHVVFCFEGGSWRHDIYSHYKADRRMQKLERTQHEQEEDEIFFETLNSFQGFIREKTRCSVLQAKQVEGDDFVARWVQLHPNDEHIIVSGDTDFIQLLAPNVAIYDGVKELQITCKGVRDTDGRNVRFSVDRKCRIRVDEADERFVPDDRWWERALFTKIVRGDSSDSIFAAYPGVREKAKTKPSIESAWADHEAKGFSWNNFMLQKVKDQDGNPALVQDLYKRNQELIDLRCQPCHIRDTMDQTIVEAVQKPPVGNVGIHFLRFCDQHTLITLSREATDHAAYLNSPYSTEAK